MTDSDSVHILGFLACLNNVHRELLYYRWRWHPQILKFYVKDFRTSLFPNSMMDLVHVWYDDGYWSKISHSTIPTPIHDLSGRVSDSGARGPGFETYLRRVVSLSKTLYSPKVLVNYPGSDGSVPT